MARLKKHGLELDRRDYPHYRVAVMSDGNIMRNHGTGWKLWKRFKEGADVSECAARIRAKYDARPAVFHEYIDVLAGAVSLEYRGQLHTLVGLMPSDPDGVYSEFNENNQYSGASVDIDDCVKLCRIYQDAVRFAEEEETCSAKC